MSERGAGDGAAPELPARAPGMLCAVPYAIDDAGDDVVACGLHRGHPGPHMAIVWWTSPGHMWPPREPGP